MADYYELPANPEKKRSYRWAVLLLLLLFLLGIAATIWSLRLKPGEAGELQILKTAALPVEPVTLPEPEIIEPDLLTETEELPAEDIPPPAEAVPEAEPPPLFSDASWRESARFTGTDAAGRSAEFTAYVLVGDETWTFARADSVFAAGLAAPVDTAFEKLNLGQGICSLSRVIAVGAASVEGTPERNTFLSRARGQALGNAIQSNVPCGDGAMQGSVLDLGYSREDVTCPDGKNLCPDLTAPQRPIAMILAEANDPDTNIGEALKTGITAHEASGSDVLPGVRISEYSGFQSAFDLL